MCKELGRDIEELREMVETAAAKAREIEAENLAIKDELESIRLIYGLIMGKLKLIERVEE